MTRASEKVWVLARITFFVLVPMTLFALPSDFFDEGQSMCLSVLLFKQECYACGLTRSVMHLLHFEFEDAYYFNPLGFIVLPALIYFWYLGLRKDIKRLRVLQGRSE